MSVMSSTRPAATLGVLPRFPATVQGSGPISVLKTGASYTFKWSMDVFPVQGAVDSLDDRFALVQNATTGVPELISLEVLHATLATWPGLTVQYGGGLIGLRPAINFVNSEKVHFAIADNDDNGRVDIGAVVLGLVSTDIGDFGEAVDDRVGSLLVAGANVSLSYDDGANTLTISAAGETGATALSQLTDVNVTEGAGIDGYRLTWNNTSGKWEAVSPNYATASQYRSATAGKTLQADAVWSAAGIVTLTDGATITPDFSTFIHATVTLGGNRTLANPTNVKEGQSGIIEIKQDGTGSRTLAFGSNWKFAGGTAPSLSTAANARDVLSFVAISSTVIFAVLNKDVK